MGIADTIGKVFGAAAKEPIEAISGVIDELYTSKEEKLTHEEVMARLAQKPMLAQIAVNQAEAGHRSIFVAGWRPGAGWVCVAVIAYVWLIRQFISDLIGVLGGPPLPVLDVSMVEVMAILGPLLGIGTLRTVEKGMGKAR